MGGPEEDEGTPQPSRSPHFSGKDAVSTLIKVLARPRNHRSPLFRRRGRWRGGGGGVQKAKNITYNEQCINGYYPSLSAYYMSETLNARCEFSV